MITSVSGLVVPGLGLGRRLGFATANIHIPKKDLPPFGVYLAEAVWGGKARPALCNVGVRPTLGPSNAVWVEVHVPGFKDDLYGEQMEVRFIKKLRDEKRFDTLDELVEQIRKDCAAVKGLRPAARGNSIGKRAAASRRRTGRRAGPS